MQVNQIQNPSTFVNLTQNIYKIDEVSNNLILGLSLQILKDPDRYQDPVEIVVKADDGTIYLSAVMTRPYPLIVHWTKPSIEPVIALVHYCCSRNLSIPGVNGRSDVSYAFSDQWTSITGESASLMKILRAYKLVKVNWPKFPAGKFRMAEIEDLKTVSKYMAAMQAEVEPDLPHKIDLERSEKFIRQGAAFVWVDNGKIVSMALSNRPAFTTITVSGVYSPLECRNKGYASACVASLSQYLLDKGYKSINLFTDMANPVSNSIYQKIGYKPVCDYHRYNFTNKQ